MSRCSIKAANRERSKDPEIFQLQMSLPTWVWVGFWHVSLSEPLTESSERAWTHSFATEARSESLCDRCFGAKRIFVFWIPVFGKPFLCPLIYLALLIHQIFTRLSNCIMNSWSIDHIKELCLNLSPLQRTACDSKKKYWFDSCCPALACSFVYNVCGLANLL